MIEVIIETVSWVIAIFLFYFFGIKVKPRMAILGFLFMQVLTWPSGLIATELKLISYPVKFFDYACKASFTFEYLVFPVVAGLFTVYYPVNSSKFKKIAYTLAVVSVITVTEVILEKYTDTIHYYNWKWYWSVITMLITLHISNFLSYWFIKNFF